MAFCAVVEELDDAEPFAAFENAANELEAQQAFEEGLEAIRPLVDTAPDEIRPSAVAYLEAFEAFGRLLADAGYNGSAVDRDAMAEITLKMGRAEAELEAYATRTC